jgi:small subunit ribosomal protein S1
MVVLSREKAEFKKNWDKILTICNEGGTITGKVKSVVKGGLLVNIGVEAFLPASQIDIIPPRNLQAYVGNTYDFKVVKINQERQNIVLSRRELIEQERSRTPGQVPGRDDAGRHPQRHGQEHHRFRRVHRSERLDGLLHITDMSWGRIGHPSEMLKVGQELDVVVLDINREKGTGQPGSETEDGQSVGQHREKFPIGSTVKGGWSIWCPTAPSSNWNRASKAWCMSPNCPGPSALPSRPTCSSRIRRSRRSSSGINREEQKISLGIRQLEANPWDTAPERYPPAHGSRARSAT